MSMDSHSAPCSLISESTSSHHSDQQKQLLYCTFERKLVRHISSHQRHQQAEMRMPTSGSLGRCFKQTFVSQHGNLPVCPSQFAPHGFPWLPVAPPIAALRPARDQHHSLPSPRIFGSRNLEPTHHQFQPISTSLSTSPGPLPICQLRPPVGVSGDTFGRRLPGQSCVARPPIYPRPSAYCRPLPSFSSTIARPTATNANATANEHLIAVRRAGRACLNLCRLFVHAPAPEPAAN
ncbi:hypothetical protein G7046_g7763 [Stylonectria norvegica]|nr:hypothetical protein G7046_g7763 [Stylonectria norvegica]